MPQEAMATLGEVLVARPDVRAATSPLREALVAARTDLPASPTSPAAAFPATCRAPCQGSRRASTPTDGACRRSCGCSARWRDGRCRAAATFNGGLGMVAIVPPEAVPLVIEALAASDVASALVREVVAAGEIPVGGSRYVEAASRTFGERPDHIGVSGAGSNLRALQASQGRGELGEVVLVTRARPSDWAADRASTPRWCRAGTMPRWTMPLAAARADVVASHRLRANRPPGPHRLPGPVLNTHRSCPRSRARTVQDANRPWRDVRAAHPHRRRDARWRSELITAVATSPPASAPCPVPVIKPPVRRSAPGRGALVAADGRRGMMIGPGAR